MPTLIEWTQNLDSNENLVSLTGNLEGLEFTISKANPEGEEWVRWVLAGPLWTSPQFLATNTYHWVAEGHAHTLIWQKLTRLASLLG